MSSMSEQERTHQENCDRFNKYKSLNDAAASAVIRATQHLVRPTEGFPTYATSEIWSLWKEWRDQEKIFYTMTGPTPAPERIFPVIPDPGQPCCFRMWGLLIQVQVWGPYGSINFLREIVLEIAANEACKSHPESCACHVPNHPWKYSEDMEALAPINAKHNPDCQCAGYRRCTQKELKPASVSPLQRQGAFKYTHQVETCACGVCHKSRVDSGTQAAYEKRTRDAADAAIASLTSKREDLCMRQDRVKQYASNLPDFAEAVNTAATAISKATAASGGSTDHPDFVKNLFAAMGTPHDSKCPHGLPFYACMPCSH